MNSFILRRKRTIVIIIGFILLLSMKVNAAESSPELDNAAFLYYQAFLICPERESFPDEFLEFGYGTADSYSRLKYDITTNENLIRLFTRATEIQKCDWLIQDPELGTQIRNQIATFIPLINADARYSAVKGDYIESFEKSMTMLRFAKYLRLNSGTLFMEIMGIEFNNFRCINRVLDIMPPNEKNLQYIMSLLDKEVGDFRQDLFRSVTFEEFEYLLESVRNDDRDVKVIDFVKNQLAAKERNENERTRLRNLTDEEIIKLIRIPYENFLNSLFEIIESNIPGQEIYKKIQDLQKDFKKQSENNPAIILDLSARSEFMNGSYNRYLTETAYYNALKAAIDIYLIVAKTGQLPGELPEGLAKDPYSGEDFEYEITDDGFTLRCREKDFEYKNVHEYEFKVKK